MPRDGARELLHEALLLSGCNGNPHLHTYFEHCFCRLELTWGR